MPSDFERVNGSGFENLLADERSRLVRLCVWLTGNAEAAEDLAQETLLAAWKNQARLTHPDKLRPWLSAIARNVCLNWSRQHYRELAHRMPAFPEPDQAGDEPPEAQLPDESDIERDLDRSELARLLDQALALLPADTAQMLVEHYIHQSSHIEIADKMGIKAGTVAVRLQRGKLSLRRLLQTRLLAESDAFGLFSPVSSPWEETNIWCPNCGQARLLGQFQRNTPDARFALRCPSCHPNPDGIMAGLDLSHPYNARLLGDIKAYKPAYARLITASKDLFKHAILTRQATCPACGHPAEVSVTHYLKDSSHSHETSNIRIICHACGLGWNKSRSAMAMALPEALRFWRENPRIRMLPSQVIESQGAIAVLTRMQSVTSAAELAVVSARETFEILGVHPESGGTLDLRP